jgi:ubiquinone/menaquinone biosynthesis C-methylase UbiE
MGHISSTGSIDPDTQAAIDATVVTYPLRERALRAAIRALDPPPGSRGLDAGCGIGLPALLLAEAAGPDGRITALDHSPAFLRRAGQIAEQAGMAGRIAFREGDVGDLPFEDGCFDWAWSCDCVGYAPGDPLPALREMARVVRPGGAVAILAWSSEALLPGYPLLEARLRATPAGIAPFRAGDPPERHFTRAMGWLRAVGLSEVAAATVVGDIRAPLSDDMRRALIALFAMRWPGAESALPPADRADFRRLCDPASPDFIVDHPDYYAFFTYSLFYGRV